jgi:hypothetical protein
VSLPSALYLLLSLILALVGLALLGVSDTGPPKAGQPATVYDPVWLSIATSLIAAGVASLLFTLIREIDQRDSAQSKKRITSLIELEQKLHQGLIELRRALLLTMNPDARRIYSVHPADEVRKAIEEQQVPNKVTLDALGLALRSLYDEQIKDLIVRGNCEVRLVVEDPRSDAFKTMCEQEARDIVVMTEDVLTVTEYVRAWTEEHPDAAEREVSVLIRWSGLNVPVTMTRVNEWMAVRTRLPREGVRERGFFEQYTPDDGKAFIQLGRFFDETWYAAKAPTAEDVESAQKRLDELVKSRKTAERV